MSYIQQHYFYITSKELINKYYFKNNSQLPILKSIHLNIGLLNKNKYFIIPTVLVLELLTNIKVTKLNKSKQNNLILKIKKNQIVGCSIILNKKQKFLFIQKLILFLFIQHQTIQLKLNKNIFTFQVHNLLLFLEIEKYFNFFNKINYLNINFKFNTTNKNYIQTLLTSLKFPLN